MHKGLTFINIQGGTAVKRLFNKRVLLPVMAIIIALSVATAGYAAGTSQWLEAWFMNIKIKVNGQEVAMDKAPFIVNGTTYVSVRSMANIFNKNIEWDGTNYIVSVTDKPDATLSSLKTQLVLKDHEIAGLREEIKKLEEQLESSENDMDDLEDDLNDDYDEYEDIEFEITLSGDEDEITVIIEVDLDDFEDEWDDLTSSDIKSYLQDICDDILDVFDDAEIEGYFRDSSSSSKKKYYEFTTSSKGKVVFDDDYDVDLDDLEDELDDAYWNYFDEFDLVVELEGDEDEIFYYIYVDYDEYEDEWEDLDNEDIEDLMLDIYYEIEDVYDDADIVGYIYNYDEETRLARFDPDASPEFRRYY
jgi:hypothetical protein